VTACRAQHSEAAEKEDAKEEPGSNHHARPARAEVRRRMSWDCTSQIALVAQMVESTSQNTSSSIWYEWFVDTVLDHELLDYGRDLVEG